MSASFTHREEEPLFTLGDFPVRLITLLVAAHSLAMIACALLLSAGQGDWLHLLSYNSDGVTHGQVWRLFSYAFLTENNGIIGQPSIWFLFQMLMLYYFGREVENGLGWQRFGILYAGLILLGPLLLQAFGYAGIPQIAVGSQEVDFAVFAAFVAMHPGAQFFFGMAARWVFVALLTLSSLQHLANHQSPHLLVLLSSCFMAILLMRRAGFEEPLFGWGFEWTLPGFRKPKPRFSVVPGGLSASARSGSSKERATDPEAEIDLLLEKISSGGIESLSDEERAALERARLAILQREGGASR